MQQRKSLIMSGIVLFLLIVGFGVWSSVHSAERNATLNIEVVPSGARLQLNGKGISGGKKRVKPGDYTISVTLSGFINESRKVTAVAKQETYVGISLVPNTAATNNWYQTHPTDAKQSEAISSHNFDTASTELADNPLIKKLPYIGAGFEFRVDYGAPRNRLKPGQPIIYIQAASAAARTDALTWIRSFNYDPSTMDIVFKDAVNPFTGAKVQ